MRGQASSRKMRTWVAVKRQRENESESVYFGDFFFVEQRPHGFDAFVNDPLHGSKELLHVNQSFLCAKIFAPKFFN